MKKTPLTLEHHAAQGRDLKFIRDYLTDLTAILSRAYPLEVSHRGSLAADAVDFLRSVLDDQVARDYPGKDLKKLNAIYYPGDAAEETTPRDLKDTVSLAIHRINDLLRPGLTEAYREPLEDVVALLREGLLPGLDAQKRTGVNAFLQKRITCACGRVALVTQARVYDAETVEALSEHFDVFTTDAVNPTCSQCGRPVIIPPAELLDLDRTDFGRSLQALVSELENAPAQGDQAPEGDEVFPWDKPQPGLGNTPAPEAASPFPKLPDDRQGCLDRLQALQSEVAGFQYLYPDSQPDFWALRLAWESVRFAWYVVAGDLGTAAEKLALVEDAVKDVKALKAFGGE